MTQGFGRGSSQGFGRGNGRGFYSQGPLDRNERHRQEEEWSSPTSDGREGRDIPVSSPTVQESHQRTPPTPAPFDDRLFMDWSSIRTGCPLVRTPSQSILVRERGQEINQSTPETSHPISGQTHTSVTEEALQEDLPTTAPPAQGPSLDRLNVMDERRLNDVRTNTSDVVVESTRERVRTLNMETNTQASIPIVDAILPAGQGDHVMIPHVNVSTSGYEPDSLRTSSMRSPSMWAQEVSTIPQLDGPGSLPMRDPIGRWMHRVSWPVEQDSSQGDTFVQRASTTRRREYPGEDSDNYGSRRPHRDQRPPDRGKYPNQGGRSPDQGGYPDGGPLGYGGPPGGGYPKRNGRPPGRGYPGRGPPDGDGGPPGDGGSQLEFHGVNTYKVTEE